MRKILTLSHIAAAGALLVCAPAFAQISHTVTSNPVGRTITVDSATCTTPCTYSWTPGTVHTVVAAGPQAGATGVQYVYASWSDFGTATHNVTAQSTPMTYTASFTTQYYLTTAGSPTAGGIVTPASGWYNSGAVVTVSGVPASGYLFTNFSGDLTGTIYSQSLTMSAPRSVNGYFGGSQTQTYATPGTYTWIAPAGVVSVQMQAWGGGGGGGVGTLSGYDAYGGGGGGGGGYTTASALSVNPGSSYTIVVGAGGAAAANGSATSALGYSAGGGGGGRMADTFDGSGGGSGGGGGSPLYAGYAGGQGYYGSMYWYCSDDDCNDWYPESWGNGGPGGANGLGAYTVGAGGTGGSVQLNSGYSAPPPGAGNAGQVLLTYAVSSAPLLTQTITSSPVGRTLTVDGTSCTTPCSVQWNSGSTHTITAAATQAGSAGTQYVFASWSDSGAASHAVSPSVATIYTANLTTQYQLTTSNSPATGGTMTPASGNWYNAGTVVTLSETPASGFTFANYSNTGGTLSSGTITMSAPAAIAANFTAPNVNNTITSNPVGRTITVDSATCMTPCTYSWMPGTVHTLVAAGSQAGAPGVQYVYANWSDAGTATHNITTSFTPPVYTANFTTQDYLTTVGNPTAGGAVTPASGWYNSGTVLTVTGVPASGYQFTNFSGDLTGTANPQSVTMSAPKSVNGYFGGSVTQTYATTGTYTWTAPAGVVSVRVQVWGGGGGGGLGETYSGDSYGGGGGGGGGYTTAPNLAVTPGISYTIVVGAGGGGGAGGGATSALGYSVGGGVAGGMAVLPDGNGNGGGYGGSGGAGGSPNGYRGGDGSYGVSGEYCYDSDCNDRYMASSASGGTGGASGSGGYTAGAGGSGANVQVNTGYASTPAGAGHTGQVLLTYAVTAAPLLTQTITSSPVGRTLTVDGTNCTTPCGLQWYAGTSHTIAAAAAQAGSTGTQYLFANWSDSGAPSHAVVPSVATTYTANLITQYQLMMSSNPANGGTLTPASGGWYNAGTVVTLSETSANGFTFANYTATGGALSSGTTVTVSAPTTVTANFSGAQTIAFAPLSNTVLGTPPYSLAATASSGLAVSFASTTASICTVSGTTVTLVALGACSITASQAGNASYLAAAPVIQAFNVTQWSQTLTFGPLSNATYGSSPFAISTDASSGLPVGLAVSIPAVCTVSSAAVTIQGVGTCTITASQAGDANYSSANPITQSFTVAPAPTVVTMTSVGSATWALVYAKVARAADGSPVNSGVVWFYDNGILTGTGSVVGGSATAPGLTTSPGSHVYTAWFNKDGADVKDAANIAPTLSLTLTSSLQSQTISFSLPVSAPLSAGTIALSASVSSGLAIAFASNSPTVCTVSGSTAALVAPGSCSITATQAGNANNAPVSSTQTLLVGPAVLTTSLPPGVVSMPYSGPLTATGGSGAYTWGASGLPGGLSAGTSNGLGSVSGTPLQVGTYAPVTVQVQDGAGNNRTGAMLPLHLRGTQKSPTPGSLTVSAFGGGTYGFAFSYVSVPGTRTVETACLHPFGEIIRPCGPVVVLAPSGTVEFIDSTGTARCIISWTGNAGNTGGSLTLAGQVGQIGADAPLTDAGVCSVDPSHSSIGPPDHESSPVVTLAITFLTPTVGNNYTVQSQWTDSGYDQISDWGNLGNWTVVGLGTPTAVITDLTQAGPPYYTGDSYTTTVTGTAGQPVTVSQNGGPQTSLGQIPSSGALTLPGAWGLADVGDYTQTYYVAGVAAVPGLSFQVRGGAGAITCGALHVYGDPAIRGGQIRLEMPVAGSSNVSFTITGASVNPYSQTIPATQIAFSSNYRAIIDTGAPPLLGEYSVRPNVPGGAASCSNPIDFFNVTVTSPPPAGPAACSSMTGNWVDSNQYPIPLNWYLTDNSGTVSGSLAAFTPCGQQFTFTANGTYNSTSQAYNLAYSAGTPAQYTCLSYVLTPVSGGSVGSLTKASGTGSCGIGKGIYTQTGSTGANDTLTVSERVPGGESSSFVGWGDQYGFPTTAIFNMTLNTRQGDPAYNFGGRKVTETNPASVPSGYAGSDNCWWSGAPWSPYTDLATTDTWDVQNDSLHGSYGPDYVGFGSTVVAYIQKFSTALPSSNSSCVVQYAQQMTINSDTGGIPETYGGQQSGLNLLVFTVTKSTISVARGGVSDPNGPRSFHF